MAESVDRIQRLPLDHLAENVYRVKKMDPDGRSSQDNFRDTLDRKEDEDEEEKPDEKSRKKPDSEPALIEDQVILSAKAKPPPVSGANPECETLTAPMDTPETSAKHAEISTDLQQDAQGKPVPDSKGHVNVVA